jgi:hypothetical protein
MKQMDIFSIEKRFKEVTLLPQGTDLTQYPLTEHIGFQIRETEKKTNGEVFTPLQLVDKMIEISKPVYNKFNMDLCAGHGQFTIRILRKFANEHPAFDIPSYLKNYHWFNEYNIDSSLKLIYIFGEFINLAVGPAQELKRMPCDENGIWLKGIFYWDETFKKWVSKDIVELENILNSTTNNTIKSSSKALF